VKPLKCCLLLPRNAPYFSSPLLPADAGFACVPAECLWSLLFLLFQCIRGRSLLEVLIALCSILGLEIKRRHLSVNPGSFCNDSKLCVYVSTDSTLYYVV
jgi:hypothetical protein